MTEEIEVKFPTHDDYDRKDEYYGPWREVECPYGCRWSIWSIPILGKVKELRAVVECRECGEEFVVEARQ